MIECAQRLARSRCVINARKLALSGQYVIYEI